MSVNRASEVWKEIKPFAIRDMNRMLDNKAGDSGDDLYAIILYDESAQKIKYYSMSADGLQAALAAASSGDIVWLPAGTINLGTILLPGNEISYGSIPVTAAAGVEVTGLTIGNTYCIEAFGGPWTLIAGNPNYNRYDFEVDDSPFGVTNQCDGELGKDQNGNFISVLPQWGFSIENYDGNHGRLFFEAQTESIYVRVNEWDVWSDNGGALSWRLRNAYSGAGCKIPVGVELVGSGINSIINGSIVNYGILTNIKITSGLLGYGIYRLVNNSNVEVFNKQIKSLIETGTAPFSIGSTTVNNNLNADLLDGKHASAFADAVHTHVEVDITDLDHDAVKIDGIEVSLTGIEDGEVLVYDSYENKLVPGAGGGTFSVDDLANVDLTDLADGDILVFDETSGDWFPEAQVSGVTVEEIDASPSVSNVTKIILPSGSISGVSNGIVTVEFPEGGSGTGETDVLMIQVFS